MVENGSTSMSDPKPKDSSSVAPSSADAPAKTPEASDSPAAGKLTKEEQWALFEKELKESDWGHQPC